MITFDYSTIPFHSSKIYECKGQWEWLAWQGENGTGMI